MLRPWALVGVVRRGNFGVVLHRSWWSHFICLLDVAGLGGRYLMMAFVVRCRAPWRKPWRMAARRDDLGGLRRNLTLFSFVVR